MRSEHEFTTVADARAFAEIQRLSGKKAEIQQRNINQYIVVVWV